MSAIGANYWAFFPVCLHCGASPSHPCISKRGTERHTPHHQRLTFTPIRRTRLRHDLQLPSTVDDL